MAWRKTKPDGGDSLRISDNFLRDNFDALETNLSVSHDFPTGSGAHYPGQASICDVDTEAVLSAYADVEGAICYPTDLEGFWTNDGSSWYSRSIVEPGAVMAFFQATAPNGWTLVTTAHDGMMTATSGSTTLTGGSAVSGGTWTISGITWDHYHGMTETPAHAGHYRGAAQYNSVLYSSDGNYIGVSPYFEATQYTSTDGTANAVTQGTSIAIESDASWRPQSIVMILAEKD